MSTKVETKKDEIRYKTTDPKRMLNKYLVNRLCRTWTEEFVDKSTGEKVAIERSEIIFDPGVHLTQDRIQRIVFHQQAGDIKESIEVSNQCRLGHEVGTGSLRIWLVKAQVDGKSQTYVVKAVSINHAVTAVTDYLELNSRDFFGFVSVKAYDRCKLLIDTFKTQEQIEEEKNNQHIGSIKFYRISAAIDIDFERNEENWEYLVKAETAERALMVINHDLKETEEKRCENKSEKPRQMKAFIDESKILNVTAIIPIEFTKEHMPEGL